jgi:rod shape-determining protein MreC
VLDLLIRYRNAGLVVLLVAQPAFLILLGRQADEPTIGPLGSAIASGISNAQSATYQAVGGIGDIWDEYFRLVDVNRENEVLRAEVHRLEEERVRLIGVMQENARLRQLVDFEITHPLLSLRSAQVIAKDITPYFRVIRIRLNVGEGTVRVGMPVVASSGLVGRVTVVMDNFCDVMLTVDADSSVDIHVQRNRARGILVGLGHENDYFGRIAYLLRLDEVEVGDVIVTSGLGGRFPPGLIVGHILEIEDASAGMYQEVIVRPSVDFSRLDEVFVITDADGL